MLGKRKRITVSEAGSQHRTLRRLKTVVFPFHIECTDMSMNTNEMSFAHTFHPPAGFGLEKHQTNAVLLLNIPKAPVERKLQRHMLMKLHFGRKVHDRSCPINRICLDRHIT